ncbi:mannosyltransferase [Microlunatus flavus]|uniref:Mannosyltransferase n=1 Tax=Microlunatus flavus TaxID=1036181 RepID=A0A1H9G5T1_9ACTN|nr:mannosyltransferase [Microlunatus flavus]
MLLLPVGAMLVVGLVGLDRRSMWRDEAASLVAADRSLAELWAMLAQLETVHALYYTFLHAWMQLGSGVVWARVPSVLAMAVAAGLVGVLGARLASVRVGLVAGLLFVANPSTSFYAQEARSTAMIVAVALLATWLLLRAEARAGRRAAGWWVGYAVAGAVLVALNLLAVLVPLTHLLTLLWWRRPRSALLSWGLAVLPALAVAGTLALMTRSQPFQVGWIPAPGPATVRDFVHLVLGPTVPLMALVAVLVLLGVLPVAAARSRLTAVALPLLVAPFVALVAASFVQPIFVARYVFPSVPAAALLAAAGVDRVGTWLAGRLAARPDGRASGRRLATGAPALVAALAVALVALGGLGTQRAERTPSSRPDDLAGAAAVVAAGARSGDAVLFLPDNRRLVALVYPASFARTHDVALSEGPVQAHNLTGRPLPLASVEANLAGSPRVWVVGRPGLAVLPSETVARSELAVLDHDFVPVETPDPHGVGITLYVRRSGTP